MRVTETPNFFIRCPMLVQDITSSISWNSLAEVVENWMPCMQLSEFMLVYIGRDVS